MGCGVWYGMGCVVWHGMCGMGLWCVLWDVWYGNVVCGMSVMYDMWCVECRVWCVECGNGDVNESMNE